MYRRSRQPASQAEDVALEQRRQQPVFTVPSPVYQEISESDNTADETHQRSNVAPDPDQLKPIHNTDEATVNDTPIYVYGANDP